MRALYSFFGKPAIIFSICLLALFFAGLLYLFLPGGLAHDTPFYDALTAEFPLLRRVVSSAQADAPDQQPWIYVWYGPQQSFGQSGLPQKQINILGSIMNLASGKNPQLIYTLNGDKERDFTLGPNERLANEGDFNLEIQSNDPALVEGQNIIVITAHMAQFTARSTVIVNYTRAHPIPLPYTIHWNQLTSIGQVAQVVNGLWAIKPDGIRVMEMGFDRSIALGDMDWKDYEVTVPITIHQIQSQTEGGVGIVARWQGYFQETSEQPFTGWSWMGGYAYYRRRSDGDYFVIRFNRDEPSLIQPVDLELEKTYYFKLRVEGGNDFQGGLYKFKAWPADQSEPGEWNLIGLDQPGDLQKGSVLLVAHGMDVTFGDVTVSP
jgi:hypothetical protein